MKKQIWMVVLLASTSYMYAADQATKATDSENTATVKAAKPVGKKSREKQVTILEEKKASDVNKPAPKKPGRKKTANPKEEAVSQDENGVQKKKEYLLTIPTCLDPRLPEGEASLKDMLKTRRNCLNGFMSRYATELMQLKEKGLFSGEVKEYNKEVMEILVDIFNIEKRYDNITLDFNRYPTFFRKDLKVLWELIKENDHHEEDTEINRLWKEMSDPCAMLVWCINYRGRHLNTYLKESWK